MSAAALDLPKYPPEVRASIEFQAPPKLSNTAFLAAIFADAQPPETLWTCHFAGSPDADAPWKGAPLTPGEAAPDRADHNTYFSVASLVPDASGEIRRRLSSFGRLFALVLDDAGSVPGIDPTWILETSKPNGRSNRQVGYRLSEPVGDVDLARRVHQALAAAGHIPSDKSGNNPVRYVRLPVGSNTKHNPPHAHKLLSWHPERAYPVETLIQALRLELDPPPRNEQREPPSEDLSGRSFFAKVNTKALARPEAWVPELFPSAKPYQGGYRVASKDLGRALEEDISVHPSGIRDFGTEEPKTAIDLAMEWGTPTT
ncbi:MAG: hypothetical protein EOM91_22100, partial [Sphingobacteriia bacterium]|nr:hypothetical protein [Sphingobacteriia bacterium]